MSSVHKAIRDLVEKRLWPVALLMVVALVAIPVIGGRGGDPAAGAGEETLPIAPMDAVSTKQGLDLVGPPSVRKRAGALVDPFRRPAKAKEQSTSPPSTDASSSGSGAAGASGGQDEAATAGTPSSSASNTTNGDKGSEPSGDKGSEPTGGKIRPSAYDLSKVADVRFGKLGGTLKRSRSLAAASPLPSEKDPIVMLAGALKETDEVRFLIVAGSGETSGDGECKLKDARCVSVDMRIGERQLFRVKGEEYELQLVSINSVRRAKSTSRTRVRFGAAGAGERSISRLEPLVGAADPALLYLGVYRDRKRALFVLGPNATAQSDGDCMDGPACRIIGLRKSETADVRVASRSYGLYVSTVAGKAPSSDKVAGDGRETLRTMLGDAATAGALGGFGYAKHRAVIVRTK